MTLSRERQPMSYTQPIDGVPFKQTCENCGDKFYYHYRVQYCPMCEDIIMGEEETKSGGNPYEFRGEYEKALRNKHILQKTDRYEIIFDPDKEGGFPIGSRLNREDIYTGLRMFCFTDGTLINFHRRNDITIIYRVHNGKLVKIGTCKDGEDCYNRVEERDE